MCRSNVAQRHHISYFIGCFSFYFALLMGATSIHIDFIRLKVHTALHYKLYAACANVALVATMLWCYSTASRYLPKFEPNATLLSLNLLAGWLNTTVLLWLLVSRWWCERRLRVIVLDLFALEKRYNNRTRTQHSAIEQRFDAILCLKAFTVSVVSLSVFRTTYKLTRTLELNTILLSLFFYCFHNILHCLQLQYFHLLWYACKQFYLLNAHLREILQQSRVSSIADQLRELMLLHSRLVQLLRRLNESNKYHTLPVLLFNLMNNVLFGYHTVQLSSYFTGLHMWLGFLNFAVVFVDENLFLWLCDDTVCVQKETAQILKEFNALPLTDGDLKEQCELFALQLKLRQPQINISGMFNLNKQSAIAMGAYILQHTLILVQFSYEALET